MKIYPLIVATLLVGAGVPAHADDRSFEQKIPASANGVVEIAVVAGSLTVEGWDRAEVAVKGVLSEDVERVDVSTNGGRTRIEVVPRRPNHGAEAELSVSVPRGSELVATTVSADLASREVRGRQRLSSVSGQVSADVAGADVEIKSVSGDVLVHGTDQPADLRLSTVSGSVRLERGAGEVEATSTSGDVNVEVTQARNVRLRSTSGDLGFRGKLTQGGTVDGETVSGEVSLDARGDAGYEYEISSFSGDIGNCFGKDAERTSRYGPGKRLNGTLGKGDGRIRVKSMSGDVNICDK